MNDHRFWTVLLAAVSFLAGTAAGLLLGRDGEPPRAGWSGYVERMTEDFDLSSRRAACLRVLLDQYDADVERVQTAHQAATRDAMADDLRDLALKYEGWIRDRVLPPESRARFDRLARPTTIAALAASASDDAPR